MNKFEVRDVTNEQASFVRINEKFVTFKDLISDEIEKAEKHFCIPGPRLYHNHGSRWNTAIETIVNKTYKYDHSSYGRPNVVHYNYTTINVVAKDGKLYARGHAYKDCWDTIYTARVPYDWEFFLQIKQEEISY